MKYTLSWQDFMRQPANQILKESKGIHACKQKFIQEQNKLMWMDPVMITENQSPADASHNSINSDGGSSQFVTGNTAHVSTFTWATGLTPGFTSSGQFGITVNAINGESDFSKGHVNTRKKILLAFTTSSYSPDLEGISTAGYDIVVSASSDLTVKDVNASGSLAEALKVAVAGQAAGAIVGGFTNTIAPSSLISLALPVSSASFTITNATKAAVANSTTDIASTTGSIAVTTQGTDTFFGDVGGQVFDGILKPYTDMPRKY